MMRLKDLTGKRFGRLVVLERAEDYVTLMPGGQNGKRYTVWRCQCDCGNETKAFSANLLHGHTQSCGCLRRETSSYNLATARQVYRSGRYRV